MLERKKDIAQEIAYLVAQEEITKIGKLHKCINRLYREAGVPTFGGKLSFEKAFIFVAAKHFFNMEIGKSRTFSGIAGIENLYHKLIEDPEISSLLYQLNEKKLTTLLFLNFTHLECNVVTTTDLKRINLLLVQNKQIAEEINQVTQRYVGYKIIEAVSDGKISSAKEKEIAKLRLSDYFGVPAPPDEEILRTFGWHKLSVSKETVAEIFRTIPIGT